MLCLSDIKITTIEPICKLNTPLLDYLNLQNNQISCIKALRRCNFANLNNLSLSSNKFIQISLLVNIDAPKLSTLFLEKALETKQPDQYINWVLKLNSHKFNKLYVANNKRLNCINLNQTIYKKYGNQSVWDGQLQIQSLYQIN